MNRKQIQALVAGATVAVIITATVPEKVTASSPTHTTLGGGGTVVRTYVMYAPRKMALTGVVLVTLGTMFALRTPKNSKPGE